MNTIPTNTISSDKKRKKRVSFSSTITPTPVHNQQRKHGLITDDEHTSNNPSTDTNNQKRVSSSANTDTQTVTPIPSQTKKRLAKDVETSITPSRKRTSSRNAETQVTPATRASLNKRRTDKVDAETGITPGRFDTDNTTEPKNKKAKV